MGILWAGGEKELYGDEEDRDVDIKGVNVKDI